MSRELRIKRQLNYIQQRKYNPKVKAQLVDNDLYHWKAWIQGPSQCPYQGGFFEVQIFVSQEHPYVAPRMKFITKILHPNISSMTGAIYIDILIEKASWSSLFTIQKLLISLQALLASPQHNQACNYDVSSEYKKDPDIFSKHARKWVYKYARTAFQQNGSIISNIHTVKYVFQQQTAFEIETKKTQDKIQEIMVKKYMSFLRSIITK